ncbi:hypothetical protein Hte_010000 [Hypoxylon texense]
MRVTSVLAALACSSIASARMMRIAAENFNVTGIGNSTDMPPSPSFKAHCSGEGEGADFSACSTLEKAETDYSVVAKLLPSKNSTNGTAQRPQIQVSLRYTDLYTKSTWWNFTGQAEVSYNQSVAPLMNFTITPDTVYGVA